MKKVFAVAVLVAGGLQAAPYVKGKTDKDPLSYKVGEDIVFTLTLEGGEKLPEGVSFAWTRTGDDGVTEKGAWDATAPLTVKTSLKRAGFMRLLAEAKTADGKPWKPAGEKNALAFDGGAAADVKTLAQSKPEPTDFDAFWQKCRDELAAVPVKGVREEIASPTEGVKLYKVSVDCPGTPNRTTGYLSIPDKPGKFAATAGFFGYGASWSLHAASAPKVLPKGTMRFWVSAHGFELGREKAYYDDLRKKAGSGKYTHGFDPVQNAKPETCYFHGMALRVMRAVEYLKSCPEWNGKDLTVSGGSQASLQSMWCEAFVPGVTEAKISVPWLCNVGGPTDGRNYGTWYPEWAPGLDYFDQVNVAKRVPKTCRVEISRIGLGDYTAPPCGAAIMYGALTCPKTAVWVQGSTHGYVPPDAEKTIWK